MSRNQNHLLKLTQSKKIILIYFNISIKDISCKFAISAPVFGLYCFSILINKLRADSIEQCLQNLLFLLIFKVLNLSQLAWSI
jgi:hypothetical protein